MFVNFDWWYHDRRVTKSLTNIGQTIPSWSHHNARADPWLEEAQGGRSAVPSAGLSGRHGQAPSPDQLVLLPAPSCLSLRIHSVALSTFSPAVDLPVIHLLTYLPNSPITKRIYQDTLFLPPPICLYLQSQLKPSSGLFSLSAKPVPNQNTRSCNKLTFVTIQQWFDQNVKTKISWCKIFQQPVISIFIRFGL